MPHQGRLTSEPVNFKHVLHKRPLLMPVAVTVARILHPSSFAHEDIGRVYKQHQIVGLRFEKDLVQPFLRFPDVLADYTGVIDLLPVGVLFIPLTPCRDGLVQEDIGSAAFWLTR